MVASLTGTRVGLWFALAHTWRPFKLEQYLTNIHKVTGVLVSVMEYRATAAKTGQGPRIWLEL